MSLNEPPALKQKNIEELKAKLNEFVDQHSIAKFDGEDIFELIEDGESIDWIVDQLKGDNPEIAAEKIAALLTDIKALVSPEKELEYTEAESMDGEAAAGSTDESDIPDFAQMDLSQLADSLPPGMELPAGLDINQLKDLMESPQAKIMSDFLLFCREKGIAVNEDTLEDPRTQDLQNEWKSTPRDAFDGRTPAEMLEDNPGLTPAKVETYRREEPRVGRNDPCPCGSGKKYKKCCGRA
jgi:preprotein translocase subunit SecA